MYPYGPDFHRTDVNEVPFNNVLPIRPICRADEGRRDARSIGSAALIVAMLGGTAYTYLVRWKERERELQVSSGVIKEQFVSSRDYT